MKAAGSALLFCCACTFDPSVSGPLVFGDDGGTTNIDGGRRGSDAALPAGSYRKSILLKPQGLSEDLSNFVVAVLLDEDSDLQARARADGADIRFVSGSGVALAFEIEEYVTSTGQLSAWVKVPTLSMDEPTPIYLYYGDAPVNHDPKLTWSDGFRGVWHYSEDPSVQLPIFANSVSAEFSASSAGDRRPTSASGIAGPGLNFDGSDDHLSIEDSASGGLDFGMASFSYSTWVQVSQTVGQYDIIWWKGGSNASASGYDLELGNGGWVAYVGDGGGLPQDIVGSNLGNVSEFLGRWVHLAVVVSREAGELRVFADGLRRDTDDISGLGSLTTDSLVSISHQNYLFRGLTDEMRIYSKALSDDWIRTEHANLTAPATFYTVGPEEGAAN